MSSGEAIEATQISVEPTPPETIAAAVERARALRNSDPAQGLRIATEALAAAQRLTMAEPDDRPVRRLLADALAALGQCERMSSSLADAARHSSAAVEIY